MRLTDLLGRRVVVWGAGMEGNAALGLLHRHGVDAVQVTVPADGGAPTDDLRRLREAEVVLKSPGIPVASAVYRELTAAGVTFTSGSDLWMSHHGQRTIGVTGSKGKSTTSSVIAALLRAADRQVELVGNVGVALLDRFEVAEAAPDMTFVAELSSYQCQSLRSSPRVAVVTSLFPEHLPWHGGEDAYYRDKLRIAAFSPQLVVANGFDARVRELLPEAAAGSAIVFSDEAEVTVDPDGRLVWDGVLEVAAGDLALPGVHNARNLALALLTAVREGSVAPGHSAAVRRVLTGFRSLPHRLETVPSTDGRRWVDDGLATAPEAVAAALEVFTDDEVALVLGGSDRGLDFTPLTGYLAGRSRAVDILCVGPAGARFSTLPLSGAHRVHRFPSVAAALAWAGSRENPARVVLLSPGAPSFDEFRNYEERSQVFRDLARSAAPPT